MKITPFWASIALSIPAVLADPTATSATPTTSTSASSCTASLITTLCSYPDPGSDFAVAEDSTASCWAYCNTHSPCNFVIFNPGNPTTGAGTCWLYPGETFDASKGSTSGCPNPYLSVYSQPVCSGGSATSTAGACAATATPSAVAEVCGYPTPPDDCFDTCSASSGATDCLSQCAKADSCSYVVFNPHNSDNSPYASGTCWMYPNGTYDAGSAGTCSGAPDQFVYNNLCPKPSPSSSSSLTPSATGNSTVTGTAGATTPGSTGNPNTGSDGTDNQNGAAASASTTTSKSSAPTGLSLAKPLALGLPVLIWQAL